MRTIVALVAGALCVSTAAAQTQSTPTPTDALRSYEQRALSAEAELALIKCQVAPNAGDCLYEISTRSGVEAAVVAKNMLISRANRPDPVSTPASVPLPPLPPSSMSSSTPGPNWGAAREMIPDLGYYRPYGDSYLPPTPTVNLVITVQGSQVRAAKVKRRR